MTSDQTDRLARLCAELAALAETNRQRLADNALTSTLSDNLQPTSDNVTVKL